MINLYNEYCDNILSQYFLTSSQISNPNKNCVFIQDKSCICVSPDILCSDLYDFCIYHDKYLPGLIYDKQLSLIDILQSQKHHYFDMVHNYILCFVTQSSIIYPNDHQFNSICTYPYDFNIQINNSRIEY